MDVLLLLGLGLIAGFLIGSSAVGRRRALRKLGEYEFQNRWNNIKKISKW